MAKKAIGILRSSFFQLLFLYSILLILSNLKIIPAFHFEILASIIAIMGIFILKNNRQLKINNLFVLLPLLLILITRLFPYLKSDIPLGFDAGIYQYLFEHSGILHSVAEPQALYVLADVLQLFINSDFILKYFLIFIEILTAIFIFLTSKKYFSKEAGFFSLLVYSISLAQFKAFAFIYYKNILALLVLLIILYAFENHFITITAAALLSGLHPPVFLIFMVSYALYSITNLKAHLLRIVLIIILSTPFYLSNPALLSPIKDIENIGPGNFITLQAYLIISLAYLPFAILGFLKSIREKKLGILACLLAVNAVIVLFRLFFFNRYIISLDLFLIVFSGYGLYLIFSDSRFNIAVILLLVLSIALIINGSLQAKPEITREKLDEIKNLPDGLYLTEREYAPWILASKERVIAPLLFGDVTPKKEWEDFFYNKNQSLIFKYKPDYIYLDNNITYPCLTLNDTYYINRC